MVHLTNLSLEIMLLPVEKEYIAKNSGINQSLSDYLVKANKIEDVPKSKLLMINLVE